MIINNYKNNHKNNHTKMATIEEIQRDMDLLDERREEISDGEYLAQANQLLRMFNLMKIFKENNEHNEQQQRMFNYIYGINFDNYFINNLERFYF